MRSFVSEGAGRLIVLNFERGEKLLEGTREKLRELGVKNAVLVSAIGTFSKARMHRVTTLDPKPMDEIICVEAPMELSAAQGIVANGEPHFHMVFSDLTTTYSGHLEEESIVLYLAELVLMEVRGLELERVAVGHVKLLNQK